MSDNNDNIKTMSSRNQEIGSTGRKYLLNCRNCDWHTYINGSMIEADYERDCHESSIRNVLTIGPHCPQNAVAICSVQTKGDNHE